MAAGVAGGCRCIYAAATRFWPHLREGAGFWGAPLPAVVWEPHPNSSIATAFTGAEHSAMAARELHLQALSLFFLLSSFPYMFQYTQLQIHWCMDLSGILVCWAVEPLLGYRSLTSCKFTRRYKGAVSFCPAAAAATVTLNLYFKNIFSLGI